MLTGVAVFSLRLVTLAIHGMQAQACRCRRPRKAMPPPPKHDADGTAHRSHPAHQRILHPAPDNARTAPNRAPTAPALTVQRRGMGTRSSLGPRAEAGRLYHPGRTKGRTKVAPHRPARHTNGAADAPTDDARPHERRRRTPPKTPGHTTRRRRFFCFHQSVNQFTINTRPGLRRAARVHPRRDQGTRQARVASRLGCEPCAPPAQAALGPLSHVNLVKKSPVTKPVCLMPHVSHTPARARARAHTHSLSLSTSAAHHLSVQRWRFHCSILVRINIQHKFNCTQSRASSRMRAAVGRRCSGDWLFV